MDTTRARRQRVLAMSPDERRAALIKATIPLVRQYGADVSTRQIAEAAGVAEGTIFGVFPDKLSLIRAAVIAAFDPEPIIRTLREIKPIPETTLAWRRTDLRRRMEAMTRVLEARLAFKAPIIAILRSAGEPAQLMASRQAILDAMTEVIEPDRDLLRRSPATIARLHLHMVFAVNSGNFGAADALTSEEIVSLLLDGLLAPAQPHPRSGESSC